MRLKLYDGSDLDERVRACYCVCGQAHRGLTVGFFYSGIQLSILLSPYICFMSFLYLNLYLLDDTSIS